MPDIDLSELRTFVSVATNESFSMAADQLFLTQPAISKRIAQLEEALSARLFDRIGKHVQLTEAGRTLLPHAQAIIKAVQAAEQSIHDLSGQISGQLILATSHHIGLHRLPPILKAFTLRYPAVNMDLHFLDSEQACHAVAKGDFELGVVTLPLDAWPSLHCVTLWHDILQVVVAKTHPLAKTNRTSSTELALHRAILPARNTFTRRLIEQQFLSLNIESREILTSNYLETIKMMVGIGLGWSILPETMIDSEMTVLDIDELKFERNLGLIYHDQRSLSNAARSFISLLPQHGK